MPQTKSCSKCGESFECKADTGGCWCDAITISVENLEKLKQSFNDCLCPDCLKEYETPAHLSLRP
jgi:hypothetical protein